MYIEMIFIMGDEQTNFIRVSLFKQSGFEICRHNMSKVSLFLVYVGRKTLIFKSRTTIIFCIKCRVGPI